MTAASGSAMLSWHEHEMYAVLNVRRTRSGPSRSERSPNTGGLIVFVKFGIRVLNVRRTRSGLSRSERSCYFASSGYRTLRLYCTGTGASGGTVATIVELYVAQPGTSSYRRRDHTSSLPGSYR